jgi:DNA-binding NarL/FixJ family response regulator
MNGRQIDPVEMARKAVEAGASSPTIVLIDGSQLSQECLATALENIYPGLTILTFGSVEDCVARAQNDSDLVIYYWHARTASKPTAVRALAAIRRALPNVSLLVFSDALDHHRLETTRSFLKSGARGVVSTRMTGIEMAVAAIRYVIAGGIFVPLNPPLNSLPDTEPMMLHATRQRRLTSHGIVVPCPSTAGQSQQDHCV